MRRSVARYWSPKACLRAQTQQQEHILPQQMNEDVPPPQPPQAYGAGMTVARLLPGACWCASCPRLAAIVLDKYLVLRHAAIAIGAGGGVSPAHHDGLGPARHQAGDVGHDNGLPAAHNSSSAKAVKRQQAPGTGVTAFPLLNLSCPAATPLCAAASATPAAHLL